jgi:hypothetical protein
VRPCNDIANGACNLKILNRLCITVLLIGLTPAAWADWMYLGSTGQKPNRVALFADIDSLGPANQGLQGAWAVFNAKTQADLDEAAAVEKRFRKLTTLEVFEAPKDPESRYTEYIFDMNALSYKVFRGTTWQRNASGAAFSNPNWNKIQPGAAKNSYQFMVLEPRWREALKGLMGRVKSERTTSEQSELQKFGYEYVQQSDTEIPDLVFKYVWTDAVRPAVEKDRLLLAKLDRATEISQSRMRDGERLAAEINRELDIRRAEQVKRRMAGSGLDARLSSWIGASESELVASQGEPTHTENRNGMRCLTYYKERTEDIIVVQSNSQVTSQVKVGENVFWWEVTFYVSSGKVIDLRIDGNDVPL